jgi:hypothetical protein
LTKNFYCDDEATKELGSGRKKERMIRELLKYKNERHFVAAGHLIDRSEK